MATKLVGYDSGEESDGAEDSSTERTNNKVFIYAIRSEFERVINEVFYT